MDYSNVSDSELILRLHSNDEEAKDILFAKYKYIIDTEIKKYSQIARMLGYDYNDLYQDALLGFSDGIVSYRDDKKTALPSFITLCVDRRLQVSIRKVNTIKNKVLNDSLSLEYVYDKYTSPLMDLLSDNCENDPLENILKEEDLNELVVLIKNNLSAGELEVYEFLVNGLKYDQIATILGKTPKQVDNAIQRLKSKIRKILEER